MHTWSTVLVADTEATPAAATLAMALSDGFLNPWAGLATVETDSAGFIEDGKSKLCNFFTAAWYCSANTTSAAPGSLSRPNI